MADHSPTIDRLLQLVPDSPGSVISYLRTYPHLASKQDAHGYSLVHAATSWNQIDLLRTLIAEFNVDPNVRDEFGETCLFNVESVDFANELLSLGVTIDACNNEGQTAADYLDDEDEAPEVAVYLRRIMSEQSNGTTSTSTNQPSDTETVTTNSNSLSNGDLSSVQPLPPLPDGVQVSIGTMHADEVGQEPDPDFRRRIEALAARQDFEGDDGQRELRSLVEDAIGGLGGEGQGATARRRME